MFLILLLPFLSVCLKNRKELRLAKASASASLLLLLFFSASLLFLFCFFSLLLLLLLLFCFSSLLLLFCFSFFLLLFCFSSLLLFFYFYFSSTYSSTIIYNNIIIINYLSFFFIFFAFLSFSILYIVYHILTHKSSFLWICFFSILFNFFCFPVLIYSETGWKKIILCLTISTTICSTFGAQSVMSISFPFLFFVFVFFSRFFFPFRICFFWGGIFKHHASGDRIMYHRPDVILPDQHIVAGVVISAGGIYATTIVFCQLVLSAPVICNGDYAICCYLRAVVISVYLVPDFYFFYFFHFSSSLFRPLRGCVLCASPLIHLYIVYHILTHKSSFFVELSEYPKIETLKTPYF